MKVYFEKTGWSGDGNGRNVISLTVYIKPQPDGSAYHYTPSGELINFKWTDPKRARVYDSSELPKEMWYSIKHGVSLMEVGEDKVDDWGIEDLEYRKISKESVKAGKIVHDRIDNVKTIEDFKALWPTIKESETISEKIMNKFFDVCGVKTFDVKSAKNGEIGIMFFIKMAQFNELLGVYGLEKIREKVTKDNNDNS